MAVRRKLLHVTSQGAQRYRAERPGQDSLIVSRRAGRVRSSEWLGDGDSNESNSEAGLDGGPLYSLRSTDVPRQREGTCGIGGQPARGHGLPWRK